MSKKLILVILLVFALAFTLVACEPDEAQNLPQNEHQHSFEDKWTYDVTYHWHKATCEHTDEVSGKASHSFKPVVEGNIEQCDVCGCTRNALTPIPELHEHTFKTEYTANEHSHWLETTCGHEVENAAPHSFIDGVCNTCGWWSSATDVLFANLSKSELWDFTVLFNDVVLNNGVNLLSEGIESAEIKVSGELKFSMSADGQIEGTGYLQTDELSLKAVVSGKTLYACGDGKYIRCPLSEALAQVGIDVDELCSYVDQINANTQQIREYVDQIKQTVNELPIDGLITDGMNAFVKVDETKSTDDLTVYVVDYEVLRTLNQTLATVTVEQYVNGALQGLSDTPLGVLLGDSFNGLPARVRTLLTQKIGTTITDLWRANYTLEDLIKQLDGVVAQYYPDDKINTLDELVAAMGVDLKGLTVKETILAASLFSPETLWNNMQEDEDKKISAKEISDNLAEWCNAYGDKTVYQIIAENNDELTDEVIKTLVDGIADMLDEYLSIEFYVDNDGILQQVNVTVAEDAEQLFDGFSGAITLKRGYESGQDYSKVIEQVEAYYDSLEQTANA